MTRPAVASFSAEWLALREPADRAARNADVLDACVRALAASPALSVCDLGAGTGGMLRALGPLLPMARHWTLVDSNAAVLAEARPPAGVTLATVVADLAVADLAAAERPWPAGTGLVTASALFDLVSAAWIERLVAALARDALPLLSTLTYDGSMSFAPAHPLDEAVVAAFNRHQRQDKGFGPAAGPQGQAMLRHALLAAGYEVVEGRSPWRLGATSRRLVDGLLDGIHRAVSETGELPADSLAAWRSARGDPALSVMVGHGDLFARPRLDRS